MLAHVFLLSPSLAVTLPTSLLRSRSLSLSLWFLCGVSVVLCGSLCRVVSSSRYLCLPVPPFVCVSRSLEALCFVFGLHLPDDSTVAWTLWAGGMSLMPTLLRVPCGPLVLDWSTLPQMTDFPGIGSVLSEGSSKVQPATALLTATQRNGAGSSSAALGKPSPSQSRSQTSADMDTRLARHGSNFGLPIALNLTRLMQGGIGIAEVRPSLSELEGRRKCLATVTCDGAVDSKSLPSVAADSSCV